MLDVEGGGGDSPPSKFRPLPFPAGTPGEGGGGDSSPSKFRPPSQLQQFNGNPPCAAGMPGEGGGGDSPPSKFRPPSQLQQFNGNPPSQRECQTRKGEGTRLLLSLDLSLSQREYQLKEGEGTCLLPNLDHPPGGSSSQEIPAHHPGGQLA